MNREGIFSKIYTNKINYLFLFPFYIFFITFFALPALKTLIYSFYKIDNVGFKLKFIGLENYRNVFEDYRFWTALKNTTLLVVVLTPLVIIVSLFIANSIYREKSSLKTFIRASIYIPAITAEVILILTWRFIFNPIYGVLNYIIGIIGIPPQDWLGNPDLVKLAVALVVLTFSLGGPLILYLASLGGIPDTYYEAALIDGANGRQRFFRITLPLLKPTTLFIIITQTIGYFQIFSTIFLMTDGGPANSTVTLVFLLYATAFKYMNLGGASVISVVLFLVCTSLAVIQYKFLSTDIQY